MTQVEDGVVEKSIKSSVQNNKDENRPLKCSADGAVSNGERSASIHLALPTPLTRRQAASDLDELRRETRKKLQARTAIRKQGDHAPPVISTIEVDHDISKTRPRRLVRILMSTRARIDLKKDFHARIRRRVRCKTLLPTRRLKP